MRFCELEICPIPIGNLYNWDNIKINFNFNSLIKISTTSNTFYSYNCLTINHENDRALCKASSAQNVDNPDNRRIIGTRTDYV